MKCVIGGTRFAHHASSSFTPFCLTVLRGECSVKGKQDTGHRFCLFVVTSQVPESLISKSGSLETLEMHALSGKAGFNLRTWLQL